MSMDNVNSSFHLICYYNMTFCTNFVHENIPNSQLVSLSVIEHSLCSKELLTSCKINLCLTLLVKGTNIIVC